MKNTFLSVFEFGEIQYSFQKSTKAFGFFVVLFFLSFNIQSQTIPSTGSSATVCEDFTALGWLITGDIPYFYNKSLKIKKLSAIVNIINTENVKNSKNSFLNKSIQL